MTQLFDLRVETRGGVCDLGRVVSVLALLDLTPLALTCYGDPHGLQIDIRLHAESRTCILCVSRLNALVSVIDATLKLVSNAEPGCVQVIAGL